MDLITPGPAPLDSPEAVVRLAGVLDVRSVGYVRQQLNDLIDSSDGDVVIDLAAVDAVDATGLGLLVAAHRRVERLGRHLVLRHPLPPVVRILAVTRLSRVLHVERNAA
jgi:anti-sigma B factor antagonist